MAGSPVTSPERLVPDAQGYVPVAGLRIPLPYAVRAIRAIRAQYPTLTQGLSDPAAIRAWLKWLIREEVARAEAGTVSATVEDAVEKARRDVQAKVEAVRSKALQDGDAILEQTPPVEEPPSP